MAYELREYQNAAIERLVKIGRSGLRRLIMQLPTGAGKTIVAAELVRRAANGKDKRVLFLAPRRELVYQCVDKLEALGVRAGIVMAGEIPDDLAQVQVATVPTLHARAVRTQKIELPPADFVIWDECHLSIAPTYLNIFEQYPEAFHLGLTATPARGDGKGLGLLWEEIVPGASVAELVKTGHLVPQRYFAPAKPDLAGIKIQAGDYVAGQLEHRMDTPKLVGDCVSNWVRLGENRQTVIFASGVKHSKHLRDEFLAVGIQAEHLDGTTPLEERSGILERIGNGTTKVLCNCFVLTYGWDCPAVSCAVIARPTKSLILYLQMCGRVLRPFPGKQDALIIDHAGIVDEHGFLDEVFPWDLDGTKKIKDRIDAERKASKTPKAVTCPGCSFVFRAASECPRCGWKPKEKPGDAVAILDGDLHEMKRSGRRAAGQWTMDAKEMFYGELLAIAAKRGYKEGWAAHKYREKLGVWPRGSVKSAPLFEPSRGTLSWVRSQAVQYRKQREARQ